MAAQDDDEDDFEDDQEEVREETTRFLLFKSKVTSFKRCTHASHLCVCVYIAAVSEAVILLSACVLMGLARRRREARKASQES